MMKQQQTEDGEWPWKARQSGHCDEDDEAVRINNPWIIYLGDILTGMLHALFTPCRDEGCQVSATV